MFLLPGENAKPQDLEVNPLKSKQLTNFRASGPKDESIRLTPPRRLTLEQAIAYFQVDKLVEVTPKAIRWRKRYLDRHERKRRRPPHGSVGQRSAATPVGIAAGSSAQRRCSPDDLRAQWAGPTLRDSLP